MVQRSRRQFLQQTAAVSATLAAVPLAAKESAATKPQKAESFASRWKDCPNRVWLGPEYWANPLQDWRIEGGRIECVNPAVDRNVHLLTHDLAGRNEGFELRVTVGRVGGGPVFKGKGSFGFRVGIRGPLEEYRNSLIYGNGLDIGLACDGGRCQVILESGRSQKDAGHAVPADLESVELRLTGQPGEEGLQLCLAVHEPGNDEPLWTDCSERDIPADRLRGNIALVVNYGANKRGTQPTGYGTGKFWFADWTVGGPAIDTHADRAFGPILFSQYTLSRGKLNLTAQMPPIGAGDSRTVRLEIKRDNGWKRIGEESIHPDARTATFRTDWDVNDDIPYRLVYKLKDDGRDHHWTGTIRRDPTDQPELVVADISCNIHAAFPNHGYVANVAKVNPDLIAFVGDQFYESTGGYGVVREPVEPAMIDYLRKWYIHGWTWRELTRDRPSISLPDDHDVYQGNIWGEAGAPEQGVQEAGGYNMDPRWVNVVHRTQTSHHPAPYDPTLVKQNITVYYGPMVYGRVSFAILADRQFKTGPAGVVAPTGGRADHVTDPNFDPSTVNIESADLLGERQLKFLADWVTDWEGADMKAVVSQTIFTGMATHHGGEHMYLVADYDTNGWPQHGRNEALRIIRKAAAVHLAGDQHLPAVVHYGVDKHRDAAVAFAGPAVNVGYPRWWEPQQPGENREPGASELTGDFLDSFDNLLTVLAVKNGDLKPNGKTVLDQMRQKASGLGIVRFNKKNETITMECWPYLADPTSDKQFEGWPVTAKVSENDGRVPAAFLPPLELPGVPRPVAIVRCEDQGELLYARRVDGPQVRLPVFDPHASYTVRLGDPDRKHFVEYRDVRPAESSAAADKLA